MIDSSLPKGHIFDIKRYAIHDGPGIRITIFMQGCPLKCWWCHNPEGIREIPGEGGEINQFKPHRAMTVREVLREIEKETLFFDESGGGVTFSGGEPLVQHAFLKAALLECKKREIHTVLDTSGYAPAEVLDSVMDDVDLFYFDQKLMDESAHETYTGVSNRLILDNLKRLADCGKNVVIRFPLIPGVTDTDENVAQLCEFAGSLRRIRDVHVLPYHNAAREKYRRLRADDRLKDLRPPSPENIERVKIAIENAGFQVRIGGQS